VTHAEECGALKTQEEDKDLKRLDKPLAVSASCYQVTILSSRRGEGEQLEEAG